MSKFFRNIFFLFPLFGFSQELITNVPNRMTTSLNGEWNYIVDPYETGYYTFHHDAFDQQKGVQKQLISAIITLKIRRNWWNMILINRHR